jgi:hypothetical protein
MVLASIDQQYILGLAMQDGHMVVMLNLLQVLSGDAQKTIAEGVLNV